MKLQIRDPHSAATSKELDCKLSGIGGNEHGVMFEATAGNERVVTSFTHEELCLIITHYREHCDIDELMRSAYGDDYDIDEAVREYCGRRREEENEDERSKRH